MCRLILVREKVSRAVRIVSHVHLSRSERPGKAEAGVLWVVVEGYPYLFSAGDDLRRRVSGRGSGRRLIPTRSWRLPGSGGRRSASRLVSSPSGGEFELAGGVEGAFADLAGDGGSGHGRVAPLAGGPGEGEVGGGWPVRVDGGLVARPAKVR